MVNVTTSRETFAGFGFGHDKIDGTIGRLATVLQRRVSRAGFFSAIQTQSTEVRRYALRCNSGKL